MADVDTDPFGEHESKPEEPTDENIPLDPRSRVSGLPVTAGGGSSTWEPERGEKETLFGGRESQRNRLLRNRVEDLYEKLSQKWARTSGVFHYNLFEIRDGKLYFRDKSKPLMTRDGKLRLVKEI